MPLEFAQLKDHPCPFDRCPSCGAEPFDQFMRGLVQSTWRRWLRLPYCAIICWNCKRIVGREGIW